MDREQAKNAVEKLFTNKFDPDSFGVFISNLLNGFDTSKAQGWAGKQYIYKDFREHINNYKRLGLYTDPDGEELEILIINTESISKLDRARTALRNFVVKWLQDDKNKSRARDYALAAFYSEEDNGMDWRFSFIKIEHEAYKDGKGKVKIRTDLTPAKRYSYLVGEHENSYTAQKQLLPLLESDYANPTIEEIENVFSVEKVTDEFFRQYKELYLKLSEHFNKDKTVKSVIEKEGLDIPRFTKKLLGQIVFLYFLQKKGWMGVPKGKKWGEGQKKFLRTLFDTAFQKGENYYGGYLQYLFYEALAKERKESPEPDYYPRFDCNIPFLNGGLFEADYYWQNQPISIPDEFFHNTDRNKAGDTGTGILDVFDRYNFTIKEDEPLEKEVAVDPEMLGKVFENMLEITERKSTGAYYTPREIVHYMCRESLIHYLDSAVNSKKEICPRKDLELFIRKGQLIMENDKRVIAAGGKETGTYKFQCPKSIRTHAGLLDEKLESIKICDPAIGSGAFPVGLLHEIVNARLHLQDHRQSPKKSAYELKRHAIQESIYGVDFDAGAVDIARLRLWLSLIVDEDDFDRIDALPNLDYKIMQGNSLISEFMGIRFEEDRHSQKSIFRGEEEVLIETFKEKKDIFQEATDSKTKEKLRKEIDDLIVRIFEIKLQKMKEEQNNRQKVIEGKYSNLADEDLRKGFMVKEKEVIYGEEDSEVEEFEKKLREFSSGRKRKPFFLWNLYFAEIFQGNNRGFDLVIGNPPYVQIQKFSGKQEQKEWENQEYETFAKTGDIYCLFYERGNRILRDGGALTFITSNKWMRANYGKKMRKYLAQKNPLTLIDFGSYKIFESATVDTNILIVENAANRYQTKACAINKDFSRESDIALFFDDHHIVLDNLSEDSWIISSKEELYIRERIKMVGTPLKDWDVFLNYGIKTGFNEAFIIDGKRKDELIAKDPKSTEIVKPVLRGRDIKRYRVEFADWWLIATFPALNINIDNYPGVRDYLKSFGKKLNQTGEKYIDEYGKNQDSRKKTGNKWFETQDQIAYYEEFEKEKIVWGNLALNAQFALSEAGSFVNAPSTLITPGSKYLLAVLNSNIGDFYIRSLGVTRNGGYFEYKPMFIEKLPVPKISKESQKPFEILVDYVMLAKEKNLKLHAAFYEQLIDGLVYELYFPEEIKTAGKEILKHMGQIKPITDPMTDDEKLTVLKTEFDRLYDPYHPVRSNLGTLDSIEQIRIVKEALK